MKIAQCLEYPIQQHGGTEVLVRELIKGLATQHELVLVSPDDPDSVRQSSVATFISSHIQWDPTSAGRMQARGLAVALRASGVAVAHFHFGGNFGWGSRRFRCSPIPYVAREHVRVFTTVHSVGGMLKGFCGPHKSWLFKMGLLPAAWFGKMDVLAHVRRELTVSRHDYELLRRWYWPLRGRFSQIYHSRLGTGATTVSHARRQKLILSVGHLAHRKGQHILVPAFAQVASKYPDWSLALVGHVGEAAAGTLLRDMVRKAGLEDRVNLAGPSDDIPAWLGRASIYVQPSLEEALGLGLQEAMAGGCACIGSRVGGIPELIEPGTGLLVKVASVQELAQALDQLMGDAQQCEALGQAAALSIRRRGMNRESMLSHYLQHYD